MTGLQGVTHWHVAYVSHDRLTLGDGTACVHDVYAAMDWAAEFEGADLGYSRLETLHIDRQGSVTALWWGAERMMTRIMAAVPGAHATCYADGGGSPVGSGAAPGDRECADCAGTSERCLCGHWPADHGGGECRWHGGADGCESYRPRWAAAAAAGAL